MCVLSINDNNNSNQEIEITNDSDIIKNKHLTKQTKIRL